MPTITIPTPPPVYVSWSCRRCGHTGGHARTTLPIDPSVWDEPLGRALFAKLRIKLARVHQGQGCIAVPDDFVLGPYRPPGKDVLGKV